MNHRPLKGPAIVTCEQCGRRFRQGLRGRRAQFCSARCRKDSYRGTCVACGGPTSGSLGRAKGLAPERCGPCALNYQHNQRVWTPEVVIEAIQAFAEKYGRPPTVPDFAPAHAARLGHEWRAERFYEDGTYPHLSVVCREFGSWSAAIEAAGFESLGGSYARCSGRGQHLDAEREAA